MLFSAAAARYTVLVARMFTGQYSVLSAAAINYCTKLRCADPKSSPIR